MLLDASFNAKLADFGWTRIKANVMTAKIGTYQWMAPEVITSHKYTEKADVFSFGVLLWELATRKPPYYGRCWIDRIRHGRDGSRAESGGGEFEAEN